VTTRVLGFDGGMDNRKKKKIRREMEV